VKRSRRGATLVELVLAMALLLPVVLIVTSAALAAARETTLATAIAEIELAHETATAIFESELGPLAPGDGVLGLTASRIRYRARRAAGRWCHADSIGVVVPLAGGTWAASRLPVPGRDSVVLDLVDTLAPGGTAPVRMALLGPPIGATCPGGAPGLMLPVGLLVSLAAHDLVQTEEVVELGTYLSGGSTWLGLLHVALGTPIEPLAGPFGPGGIVLSGLDASGAPTTVPALVRAIQVQLGSPSGLVPPRLFTIVLRG
jgi:hypothetical protein